jgi:hypothetical protein
MVTVKGETAIEALIAKILKVGDMPGRALRKKAEYELTFTRLNNRTSQFSDLKRGREGKRGLGSDGTTIYTT